MGLLDTPVEQRAPIREDAGGVFRVGATRVRLDTVVTAYNNGCSPEVILRKYPSLQLAEIHAVIAYYLGHRQEVDEYIEERERIAEEVRQRCEERYPSAGLREKLLARRASQR